MEPENPGANPAPAQPEIVSGSDAMPQTVFSPTNNAAPAATPETAPQTPAPEASDGLAGPETAAPDTPEPAAPVAPQAAAPAASPIPEAPSTPMPAAPAVEAPAAPVADSGMAGGVVGGAPVTSMGGKRRLPKFIVPLVAAIVILGGSASAYFGYVVPNKPENMWHSALVNTGKGYDKLSTYATTAKHAKGWSENGTFKFTGPVVVDGALNGKSDGQNGDFTGSVSATGLKVSFDVRGIKSTGDTPDFYFKVDGLQDLGSLIGGFGADPSVAQALNGLNNQWYVVDHTLFEQYAKAANANTQVTSEDVSSILNAVGKASKQYVFTSDDSKAVVVVKDKVGKEKLGNRSVYHYKVTVNKEHLKSYVTALCGDLKSSRLSKIVPSEKDMNCTEWQKQVDSVKDGGTADAWVDTHTKLIHDIRFYDKTDKNSYFDVGQDYQGGTAFPFLLSAHSKSGDTTTDFGMKLTLDTKTNAVTVNGELKMSGQDAENGTINLTLTPNNEPVKVEKPAGAKTIIQLMNDLGLGELFSGAADAGSSQPGSSSNVSISAKSRNAERQTDMNSLQTQLEAFFAQNGYYPSLTDMNSASWRAANMKSLDPSALKDPQGATSMLVASPAANVYAYSVSNSSGKPCESDDTTCAQYTLTATLEGGGTYSKSNLD